MKNGVCTFTPPYYLLGEKDQGYEKDIYMEYLDLPNLTDYLFLNKQTLSFHTKIYFSVILAQALRYLSEYHISHLDLKPSNIMLSKKLGLKLIDFGESYHP